MEPVTLIGIAAATLFGGSFIASGKNKKRKSNEIEAEIKDRDREKVEVYQNVDLKKEKEIKEKEIDEIARVIDKHGTGCRDNKTWPGVKHQAARKARIDTVNTLPIHGAVPVGADKRPTQISADWDLREANCKIGSSNGTFIRHRGKHKRVTWQEILKEKRSSSERLRKIKQERK